MSVLKDAIDAMNKVALMNDRVERAGNALTEIAKELRDHEGRLIRLETFIEVAKSQQTKLPKR